MSDCIPMDARILHGVGAWADGKALVLRDATDEQQHAEISQHNIRPVSDFNDHPSSQQARFVVKQDQTTSGLVQSSGESNPSRLQPHGPNTSMDRCTCRENRCSADSQSRQFHCRLSARPRGDPWHGMHHQPISEAAPMVQDRQRPMEGSSPSTVRAEDGSVMDGEKINANVAESCRI